MTLPWGYFQPEAFPPSYDEQAFKKLALLLEAAARHPGRAASRDSGPALYRPPTCCWMTGSCRRIAIFSEKRKNECQVGRICSSFSFSGRIAQATFSRPRRTLNSGSPSRCCCVSREIALDANAWVGLRATGIVVLRASGGCRNMSATEDESDVLNRRGHTLRLYSSGPGIGG